MTKLVKVNPFPAVGDSSTFDNDLVVGTPTLTKNNDLGLTINFNAKLAHIDLNVREFSEPGDIEILPPYTLTANAIVNRVERQCVYHCYDAVNNRKITYDTVRIRNDLRYLDGYASDEITIATSDLENPTNIISSSVVLPGCPLPGCRGSVSLLDRTDKIIYYTVALHLKETRTQGGLDTYTINDSFIFQKITVNNQDDNIEYG